MKKSTKVIAGLTAVILTLGIAGCGKSIATTYPDYYNPTGAVVTGQKYTVNVQSVGGFKLDGVKVKVKSGDTVIKQGVSENGVIEFNIPLGAYKLEVDETSLPKGYYLDDTTYTTNPEKREDVNIKIASKVTDKPSATYSLGQIMGDFTLTDSSNSKSYKLSDVLKTKKAVMINFFYTTCSWCIAEFPSVQRAYMEHSNDIEILAICSTDPSHGDTPDAVNTFKRKNGLTFPMGMDPTGLESAFGVEGFPTTFIVDRYGMIAFEEPGAQTSVSFWDNLFTTFSSDNYVQNITSPGEGGGSSSAEEMTRPDVTMPATGIMANAATGGGAEITYRPEVDDEYSWPFVTGSDEYGSYICSSNAGVKYSYAIVYCDVKMRAGELLSFEYWLNTEKNHDYLYVLVDGRPVNAEDYKADGVEGEAQSTTQGWSGNSEGWKTFNAYVSDRDKTVALSFVYQKDGNDEAKPAEDEDIVKIKNIHLSDSAAIADAGERLDVMRPAVEELHNGSFRQRITPVKGDDGLYHKGTKDGPLLYVSLVQPSSWTDAHMESATATADDGTLYYNTLYYMSFYMYSTGANENLKFIINGHDYTEIASTLRRLTDFMESPYYLVPVNQELYDWMNDFVVAYEKKHNFGMTNPDEWLEFCYYYDHYGLEHSACKKDENTIYGLTMEFCDTVTVGTEAAPAKNVAEIKYPMQIMRGTYYKLVAEEDGVYQIRTDTPDYGELDPVMYLYDQNGVQLDTYGKPVVYDAVISGVLDHDQFTGAHYRGFSRYLELKKGTYFVKMCVDYGLTGEYDFYVSYLGKQPERLLVCSTQFGLYDSFDSYGGIDFIFENGAYYPNLYGTRGEKPIYIDMTHRNYFIYGTVADPDDAGRVLTLEEYINRGYFLDYGDGDQQKMEAYLAQAKSNDGSNGVPAGCVVANREIVEIMKKFIEGHSEYSAEQNGWLAFACYYHKFGGQ